MHIMEHDTEEITIQSKIQPSLKQKMHFHIHVSIVHSGITDLKHSLLLTLAVLPSVQLIACYIWGTKVACPPIYFLKFL